MCQDTPNTITKSEKDFSKAMRSVVAKKAIKSGEKLTIENITTKRPLLGNTIPALVKGLRCFGLCCDL